MHCKITSIKTEPRLKIKFEIQPITIEEIAIGINGIVWAIELPCFFKNLTTNEYENPKIVEKVAVKNPTKIEFLIAVKNDLEKITFENSFTDELIIEKNGKKKNKRITNIKLKKIITSLFDLNFVAD